MEQTLETIGHGRGEAAVGPNRKIRMLLSSKNVMFLEGIRAILGQDPSIQIVGEARQLSETVEKADVLHPHVVLLDGVLTDFSTLDAIQNMRRAHAKIKIMVLSVSGRLNSTAPLLAAGASMYVPPEIGPAQLFHWIHAAVSPDGRQSVQHVSGAHMRRDQKAPRPGGGNLRIVKRTRI
ncbi:MAG: hypothetical protein A3F68_08685 [Acidobacteria bacterium RIFCSPLOWO2_12_FULL_54_10]|nr:MAG: hypothetical protein A3F68_08685 [Acidobacteria bacterium RIFCSPLOWO2_12_FULL_54_10]